MAFDLASARPVSAGGFDLASARPVDEFANVQGGASSTPQAPVDLTFAEKYVAPALEAIGGAVTRAKPLMPPVARAAVDVASNPAPIMQAGAELPVGVTQILASLFGQGDKINPTVQAQERAYQTSRGPDADSFDLTRTVASVLNPLPIKAAGMLKPAATVMGRTGQGAAVGGATAAAMPVYEEDFWGHKGLQAATGTVVGAAMPPVVAAAKAGATAVRNIAEPHLPGGIERIAGRTANKVAGDKADDVVSALERDQRFVAGSRPTAGEAAVPAGSTEFAGLGNLVERRAPSDYRARDIEQGQARLGAVREVGGTKDSLAAAEANRKVAASRNYERAYANEFRADPELAQLSANPYFKDALPVAFKLAKAEKIEPKKGDLTRFLHFVKLSMDEAVARGGDNALGSTQKAATEDAKATLVSWLGKKNPDYDAARAAFAADSVPINQQQIGQELEKKLVPALNTVGDGAKAQRADLFSTAVREAPATIKKATGAPRYDSLDEVLSPDQLAKIDGVAKDLARSANYDDMGRKGAEAARKIVGAQLDPKQLPGMIERTTTLINAVLRRIQGGAEEKSLDLLAKKMQDPKEMARIMRAATEQERHGILASTFGAAERASAPIAAAEGAAIGKAGGGEPTKKPKNVPNAPRDRNERVVGAIYRTPKGDMEWSENGWLTLKR